MTTKLEENVENRERIIRNLKKEIIGPDSRFRICSSHRWKYY